MEKTLNLNLGGKDALIIADMQNDFLPGGALAIKDSDEIIPILNEYAKIFGAAKSKIIAAKDWHPPNHISFVTQGGPWAPHCVQNTKGAEFNPNLKLPEGTITVLKATNPAEEAYSVFDGTGLAEQLKELSITRIFIGGLATDYCIVNSVLDARRLGLEAFVLLDGTRGINVKPGDVEKALEIMRANGAKQVTLADLPEPEVLSGVLSSDEVVADEPLGKFDVKKKARMRPKGSYKQVRRERG